MTLPTFAAGDTDYVAKLNSGFGEAEGRLETLESASGGASLTIAGSAAAFWGLFQLANILIGEASYKPTGSGTDLTVAAGAAWLAATSAPVYKQSPTILSFSGQSAGTYYVQVDNTGAPSRSGTSTGAMWSVAWTGTAFGAITRTAAFFPSVTDFTAALTSTVTSTTYDNLDARLEAIESAVAASGSGTVTSVALTAPAIFSVGGSPVTTTGTLALSLATQSANLVWSGPTTGAAATPTFRALGITDLSFADTDTTLAANSDTRLATQKAVKAYVDNVVSGGAAGVMVFKGTIDCSANPNYPAATQGWTYKISVAGKIGGASGVNVEIGDTIYCTTTAVSGDQATVGTSWNIVQENIDGAVTGPGSSTTGNVASFNGTSGKIVQDTGVAFSTDGTFAANSDALSPTQKAVKTWVTAQGFGTGTVTASSSTVFTNKTFDTAGTGNVFKVNGTTVTTTADMLNLISGSAQGDLLYRNATTWVRLGAGTQYQKLETQGASANPSWADTPIVFGLFFGGKPAASELLYKHKFTRQLKLVTSLTGSQFDCNTNPAATWTFTLNKNGSSIGTVAFSTGGTPTVTFASDVTFAVGDNLTITAQGTQDSTGADASFDLKFALA